MQYMLTVYEMNYSNQSIRTGAHEARIDKWKQAHPSPPPPYIVVICCHISATKIDEEDFKVPNVGNFSLLAWFLNDYFASFFSLSNVGIDRRQCRPLTSLPYNRVLFWVVDLSIIMYNCKKF